MSPFSSSFFFFLCSSVTRLFFITFFPHFCLVRSLLPVHNLYSLSSFKVNYCSWKCVRPPRKRIYLQHFTNIISLFVLLFFFRSVEYCFALVNESNLKGIPARFSSRKCHSIKIINTCFLSKYLSAVQLDMPVRNVLVRILYVYMPHIQRNSVYLIKILCCRLHCNSAICFDNSKSEVREFNNITLHK